jgi:hypothetical protein
MKKKKTTILAIAVVGLLAMTVAPLGITAQESKEHSNTVQMTGMQGNWIETFDSYGDGHFLDGTADDGGWKGWDNDPVYGAYVTSDMSLSSPHSVQIEGSADLIHEFFGYTSGKWTFYANVYVPDDYEGTGDFILLDYYEDGGGQEGNHWQVQLCFDSNQGVIEAQWDGEQLPLITNRWVQIRIEIDLDNDWYECYYDGVLLEEKEWTAGINNDYNGFLNIGCVDLWANSGTPVYYDNLALVETGKFLGVGGSLSWVEVEPSSTVTGEFTVQNVVPGGNPLNWEVSDYPDWGTWTFTPSSGDGLKNEDGAVTVAVEVEAPSGANSEFSGEVKIVNKDNPDDFGMVPVSLATPITENEFMHQLLEMLVHRFPLLERILQAFVLL